MKPMKIDAVEVTLEHSGQVDQPTGPVVVGSTGK